MDPPYCSGGVTESGKGRAGSQGLRSSTTGAQRFKWFDGDNMTLAGLSWLLRQVAIEAFNVMPPTGSLLVFCDWRMAFSLGPAIESAGFRLRNVVVWDKGHMGLGTGFRPRHEMILHLTCSSPTFHAADVANVVTAKRVHASQKKHPTEKPVDLMRSLIRVVTPEKGTVLDPFCGSGSTGEAALSVGRNFVGIERCESYCAVARRRLAAVHVASHTTEPVTT